MFVRQLVPLLQNWAALFFFFLATEISSIHAAVERLDRGEEEKKRLYACPESDETFMMCFGSHPVILAEEMKN